VRHLWSVPETIQVCSKDVLTTVLPSAITILRFSRRVYIVLRGNVGNMVSIKSLPDRNSP
jgi:hypothetical protein